jgi:hypothetical protein
MNSNTAVNSTTIIFTPPPEGLYPDPVGLLLARWLVLGRSVGLNPTSDIIAAECVFYWAVHTYNASVTSNSVSESIVGTSVNFEKNSTRKLPALNDGEQATVPWSYIIRPDPCYVNGMIVSASDARCAFSVWGDAHTGLRNYLGLEGGSSLRGAATVQNNGQENRTFDYNSQFIFFMLGRFGNADVGQMFDRVQMIAGQGSQMLTTQVRQQPISGNSPQTYVFDRVFGTQIFQFAIYSARWAYMAYPIALTTLATLFFGITTFRTRNEPKWKNSVLAFLFHGLVHEDMVRHGEVPTIVGMRAASEGLLVKLADTQHGEKLVSKDLLSTGHTS